MLTVKTCMSQTLLLLTSPIAVHAARSAVLASIELGVVESVGSARSDVSLCCTAVLSHVLSEVLPGIQIFVAAQVRISEC